MRKTKWTGAFLFLTAGLLFSLLSSLNAQTAAEDSLREAALRFIRTAETRLAPVYGPLAGQIVSRFELGGKEGTGIDLGSGPGHLILELAKRTRKMHWINADINPHFFPYFLEQAKKAGVSGRVEAVTADAQALPFESDYADIIVSRGSFQFWKDKKRAFAEIYRVLKPGGAACIGRGFSENLPVEVARRVRQGREGGPEYDLEQTEALLREVMQALEIKEYEIRVPKPPGSEGVSYGIWLEFHKPPGLRREGGAGETVYAMDTIVVTATAPRDPVAEPKIESAGLEVSSSVVTQAEITRQGAKTVIDALEYVPGAWIESRGRKVKQFFSIRGQRYPYPDYALDGAWQREFLEIPFFFSTEDVARLEVMRSSAALLTGLSGLVGVVNIIPREYTERETSLQVEYGSFNTYRLNLAHGGRLRKISYALSLGTPRTDGPKGRHAAEGITHFRGSARWNPNERWSVTAHFLYLDGYSELAQAKPPAMERLQTTLEKYDPYRGLLASIKTFYHPSEKASTELIVNFSERDHTFISETVTPAESTSERDYEYSANLTQSVALGPDNVLRVGGLYNHWVAPNGKRFYVGKRCDLETYSAVAVDEHRFGPLSVDLGLRWARTYINQYGAFSIEGSQQGLGKVRPIADQWEPPVITTSLGGAYTLSRKVSLHFNLSSGSIKPGRGSLDISLQEPKDEKRVKLDFGVQVKKEGTGQVSVAGFLMKQKDALVLSGSTQTVGGRVIELYLNRDQDQAGIEVDARGWMLDGNLQLFLNFLAMSSRAEIEGRMARNRELPRFITSGGVYATRAKYDFNIMFKYVSAYENERFAENPLVPHPLGEYNTLNVTLGRSFGLKPRNRVYLEIRNLTNDKFSTVVGYPDYGRRLTLGMRSTFK
ncbi:MAG TPA: TonB-dependent receptor [archaeon]|nr:TonB-dependent receptor [archaeon]